MVGNIVPVIFSVHEVIGSVVYSPEALYDELLRFAVVINMETEVELDGRPEEKASEASLAGILRHYQDGDRS
jgi:hypothetical protein